jgi:hypothetical protein
MVLLGAAPALMVGFSFGSGATPALAAGTTYYFHGTTTDDANRAQVALGNAQPSAVFDTTAPTGTGIITQTVPSNGNKNQTANALSAYWYANFSGNVTGDDLYLDWYWSSTNAEAVALGVSMTLTVYADPSPLIATTTTHLGQGTVNLGLSADPTHPMLNHTLLPVSGTVAGKLLIQITSDVFVDTGQGNTVHYDSTAAPSSFHFDPPPTIGTSGATVAAGPQVFANYGSPAGFQTRDVAQRQNSGEPSIGSDWNTGKIMYMAGTQVSQIGFDTTTVPPAATWKDVTPAQLANVSEDSILFTNSLTNRTWAEDFLLNPGCNANMALTDADGGPGGGPTAAATNSAWTPEQCPFAVGPDHPSVGAGPYHGAAPISATDTKQVVYYCAQNVLVTAGAECSNSTNGGLTWNAPAHIFGTGTPCNSIHGHIRVSPDGTMYVPQDSCGGHQGMAVSQDNGSTFTYSVVPDANPGVTDPSVASDRSNNLYFGYEDGGITSHPSSQPRISVSTDHGATWSPSVNVGTPFGIQNAVFPEVIAGDTGRAAFAFLGTTTGGDYQLRSFTGVWYLYIAYTYDGGASWQVVNATPGDPVQRGCVDNGGATGGAYGGCRNMLDFNEITVDLKGRVYVSYTDGCTTDPNNIYNCDTNTTINDTGCDTSGTGAGVYSENASEYSTATCTYGRQSALVRQVCGQGLFSAGDPGFFEGPTCTPTVTVPETPTVWGLALGGLAILGVTGEIRRRRHRTAHTMIQ